MSNAFHSNTRRKNNVRMPLFKNEETKKSILGNGSKIHDEFSNEIKSSHQVVSRKYVKTMLWCNQHASKTFIL